jgi:Cys-tRNA(Pro)/Cys-tRNA(Cys) deacylase
MAEPKQPLGATPATRALNALNLPFQTLSYDYDPEADAIGLAAAEALGLEAGMVFKTLVCITGDGRNLMAVIPSDRRLDVKAVARACGAKTADLAPPALAERLTGYVIGGISPLGGRKRLPVWLAADAEAMAEIVINGGRRGLQIKIAPKDLLQATNGRLAPICI